ncbi:long polar fimbrial protein LpfE [Enterobacter sp.]|uniref:long polar fimbrial protein LpfE n=1 Tax=Enterobacter sp. TaxID=42895 RepID=UPI00296EFBB8|nr:long polar fimbrial protein LpfE [Enterobacter sp.]
MKWINAVIAPCLLLVAVSATAAEDIEPAGELRFSLTIAEGTCELDQELIEVEMGPVALKRPVVVGRGLNETKFSIGLKNCSNATSALVTMGGSPDDTNPELFALERGGATGIALQIKTNSTSPVVQKPVATDSTPVSRMVLDGKNSLNYIASYVPVSPNATPGAANAVVTFNIQYE